MWEEEAVTEYERMSQSLLEWTDELQERQLSLCPVVIIRVLYVPSHRDGTEVPIVKQY
jgi:hypothetical protein